MTTTTRNLRQDYLSGAESLRPFYRYWPGNADFAAIAADKAPEKIDRSLLARVIEEQYRDLDMGESVASNLKLLEREDAFTITTGHQLVLFGGPMFMVYKILSVIRLSEQLRSEGLNVLPVFWIHTEDHDFEEINHYFAHFGDKRTYPGSFRTQVGEHRLEASIEAFRPKDFPEALATTYRPGMLMKEAFRAFIHQLFGPYGLLILDADDPRLKARFSDVIRRELQHQFAHEQVNLASHKLLAQGYHTQITPREINLFYLDGEGRNRIVAENGHYEVLDRDLKFSRESLLGLVEEHPERFSPNVSLRPLYQEMILPNLAYVGGWGELAYWLQLRQVFEQAGVNFPLLLPRLSGTIFTAEQAREWQSLGFALDEIRRPLHRLYEQFLPQVWDNSTFESYQVKILSLMDALEGYIQEEVSPTLARSADALETKTARFLKNLEKKAGKIMRQRHAAPFRKIETLKRAVEPEGLVQERILSLASFAACCSPHDLIGHLYADCDPLSMVHQCWVLPK